MGMIFDKLGLPRDTGATDFNDSARLAGIMTAFGWPQEVDLRHYVSLHLTRYVRHPLENKYSFSRDQAICLVAGFKVQGHSYLVSKELIDGKDFFSPSQNGHVRICRGLKPHWYQNLWLWLDVLYNILLAPTSEPNQLLCMLMIHPNKFYLRFWLKHNKKYKQAIEDYWCGWRNEPELARHMISKLDNVLIS